MKKNILLVFLVLLSFTGARAADVELSSAISAAGNILNLNGSDNYYGGAIVNKSITIEGNGATIDVSVPVPGVFKEFQVDGNVTVTLKNMTISGGEFWTLIARNGATLNLENVTATGNSRALVLETSSQSTISGSSLTGDFIACAVVTGATLNITNSTLTSSGNQCLLVENASATADGTNFTGSASNLAAGTNASIDIRNTGNLTPGVVGFAFSGNSTVLIDGASFSSIGSRAIYLEDSSATIKNVTFNGDASGKNTKGIPAGTIGTTLLRPTLVSIENYTAQNINSALEITEAMSDINITNFSAINCNGAMIVSNPTGFLTGNGITLQEIKQLGLVFTNVSSSLTGISGSNSIGTLISLTNGTTSISSSTFTNIAINELGQVIDVTGGTLNLGAGVKLENTLTETAVGGGIKATGGVINAEEGVQVLGHRLGIHLLQSSTATIRNAELRFNGEGVYVDHSTVTVEDSIITDNTIGQGLQSEENCNITFRRNIVQRSVESGLGMDHSGSVLVEDNYFSDLTLGGVSVSPAGISPTATIRRNTIYRSGGPAGMFCTGEEAVWTFNQVIRSKASGILDDGANNKYRHNFYTEGEFLFANIAHSANIDLINNYITNNPLGYLQTSGNSRIQYNDFTNIGDLSGDDFCIFVASSSAGRGGPQPTVEIATGNSFRSNTASGMWVDDGIPVPNAENNWWDSITGPFAGPGTGSGVSTRNTDYQPWLFEPLVRRDAEVDIEIPAEGEVITHLADGTLELAVRTASPKLIQESAVAVWTNPELLEQSSPQVPGVLTPLEFMTILADARITIYEGSVTVLFPQSFLYSSGANPASVRLLLWDDELDQWNELPTSFNAGTLECELPTHAGMLSLARDETLSYDNVSFLLGEVSSNDEDLNLDGIIDAADLL